MDHRVVEDYLDEYLRGLLAPEERERFETHRLDCPDCTALFAEAKQQFALEQRIATEMHIPHASLKVNIAEALTSTGKTARTGRSWLLPTGGLIGLATAVCAVLLFRSVNSAPLLSAAPASSTLESTPPTSDFASIKEQTTSAKPLESPPFSVLSHKIGTGYRAMTIEVDSRSGVEGWAQPGTRVDVLLSYDDKSNGKKVSVVSKSAEVLAFDEHPSSISNGEKSQDKIRRLVTIRTTELDGKKIELARSIGTLSLVMLGEEEEGRSSIPAVTLDALLPYAGMPYAGDTPPRASEAAGVFLAPDPETGETIKYELFGNEWRKATEISSRSLSSTESSTTTLP